MATAHATRQHVVSCVAAAHKPDKQHPAHNTVCGVILTIRRQIKFQPATFVPKNPPFVGSGANERAACFRNTTGHPLVSIVSNLPNDIPTCLQRILNTQWVLSRGQISACTLHSRSLDSMFWRNTHPHSSGSHACSTLLFCTTTRIVDRFHGRHNNDMGACLMGYDTKPCRISI